MKSQLSNEMQYTIRELHSTERKHTKWSERIERIVKPSAPPTPLTSSPKWDAIYDQWSVLYDA